MEEHFIIAIDGPAGAGKSTIAKRLAKDLGVSYLIVGEGNLREKGWLSAFKELSIGAEIFNIFDVQNSISNTFVRDTYTKVQYSIPNFLTPRVFNVRTTMKF